MSADIGGLLAHLMGGAGAGGPGGPDPSQGPGGPPPGGPDPSQGGDDVPALLQQALDAIHKAFAAETEPIDKAAMAKIMTDIQNLFAQEQKEKDAAMGGGNLKLMRRNR